MRSLPNYTSPYMPNVEFSADDVAANRQGNLTPGQEATIRLAYGRRIKDISATIRWFLAFYAFLMIVGFIVEYTRKPIPLDVFIASQGGIFALVLAGLLLMLGMSSVIAIALAAPLRNRRISSVEGRADLLSKEAYARGLRYMRYELRIRDGDITRKLFRLANQSSLDHFAADGSYRVYFIDYPQLPILLSAERL